MDLLCCAVRFVCRVRGHLSFPRMSCPQGEAAVATRLAALRLLCLAALATPRAQLPSPLFPAPLHGKMACDAPLVPLLLLLVVCKLVVLASLFQTLMCVAHHGTATCEPWSHGLATLIGAWFEAFAWLGDAGVCWVKGCLAVPVCWIHLLAQHSV